MKMVLTSIYMGSWPVRAFLGQAAVGQLGLFALGCRRIGEERDLDLWRSEHLHC